MIDKSNLLEIGEWTVRQRLPSDPGSGRVILLLHGWTGDENAMWIFTPRLPENYLVLSPRGITPTPIGGYGWQRDGVSSWPLAGDFDDAIQQLFGLLESFNGQAAIDVMGFSQGAALAYTMLLKYPERIGKLAGLSGFLPQGLEDEIASRTLEGKRIFVSHGTRDDLVSLEQARSAVALLKSAGADVIYCEEDVGHKLSAGCFRAMDDYFKS
jgi:phospholipase/carboxylesterase